VATEDASPQLVEQNLIERFRRDGFVVVPDLLTDEETDTFGAAVTAAVAERTAGDRRPLSEKSTYQQSFVQCMNLWEDFDDVRPLTFHPRLGQAAAELLGVDAIRVWHDQALYKLAGGRQTDAHQDHPYWPMLETSSITAWIPFATATRASGSLAFLPGSHTIGLRKFVNIFSGDPDDLLAHPEVRGIEPVFVDVPKGSVSFHHGLTVHFADGNVTDRDRAVHTIIYFRDGNTRGYPSAHFAVDRASIDVGQPIRSDVTPIAWPRPSGDLPPVPPQWAVGPLPVSNPGAVPLQRD
jgi:ectoine hydroxylase-related dioxygenase (phytanoyl-CoA dioxygenase family)